MKYLVGFFGCATAGNVYCVCKDHSYCMCAKTIHELHNAKKQRSLTYIDDGWLIDTADSIQGSVSEYIFHVEALLWKEDVNNISKVNEWHGELIGIGWHLQPKSRGMDKLLLGGFEDKPKGGRPPHLVRDRNPHGGKGCLIASYKQTSNLPSGDVDTTSQRRATVVVGTNDSCVHATQGNCCLDLIGPTNPFTWPIFSNERILISRLGGVGCVSRSKNGIELEEFKTRPVRWTHREKELFWKRKCLSMCWSILSLSITSCYSASYTRAKLFMHNVTVLQW